MARQNYAVLLSLGLAALLALRLAGIYFARIDLGLDEAQYWSWSRELAFGYFSKPPLIAWLIRGASEMCGQSEACIRSASPVLYTAASVMLFLTGRALFDERVGFWSAIVFATLPGMSYSSLLITTDVPLILFWTIALYFWVMLVKRRNMTFAVLFGMAVGIGLLAKQAMIYAALCVACHALVSSKAREALRDGRGVAAMLVAVVLFSPNVIWNVQNGFPTVKHTGANIGWQYPYVHPLPLIEYVGVQFGIFGPILFVVLLRAAWREIRQPSDQGRILLLSFSLPVLALLFVQALLSRAHGNWSATAYPAASILVAQVMLELDRRLLFRISLGLHLAIAAILAAAPAFATQWRLFEQLQFLQVVSGWRTVADAVRVKLAEDRYGSILVDSREMAANLLYYLRDTPTPLYIWRAEPSPRDHYGMTRPLVEGVPEPILFVTRRPCPPKVLEAFGAFTDLGTATVPIVKNRERVLHFCQLAGYRSG